MSFGYQPQDFEYDNQEDQYRLNIGGTGFGDEEDDMNDFDMNEFESMISSSNNNRVKINYIILYIFSIYNFMKGESVK